MTPRADDRQRLLLLFAPADHPHRDAACATLAWLSAAEGSLFECYFDAHRSGVHHGGGHPAFARRADLRGGTFTGGHHLEQFYLLVQRFDCTAMTLGPSTFDGALAECGVPVRSRSPNIASFYKEVFGSSSVAWPKQLLVVGDGGRPNGVSLASYAFPEVVHRKLLAIASGDPEAMDALSEGLEVESLWHPPDTTSPGTRIDTPADQSIETQTIWMAERWKAARKGFLIGDPELVGRWTPTAVREGWAPIFGIPQAALIERMRDELVSARVVFGRQQDDRDFLELSRLGVGFQLIDPGRPPFPVVRHADAGPVAWPTASDNGTQEPDDADLMRWAHEGNVVASLLFWSGMVRELENLYALADLFSLSGVAAGLVLSSESFHYMARPPLTLAYMPRSLGGLAPQIELLLASGGIASLLESESPHERFASTLRDSVDELRRFLGPDRMPRGWWGVMDAPMVARARPPRLTREPDAPFVRIRYKRRADLAGGNTNAGDPTPVRSRRDFRSVVRASPLGRLFEPLRPFDAYEPGPPGRRVLEAVRDAGFEYAFTKSAFGGAPGVVSGIDGLTTLNYTVGRWDGWTPFVTVNTLSDLVQAERRLLRDGRPGWLVGTIDTCLWAFTGPIWQRAGKLRAMCDWLVAGGSSGRLINVTPRTAARYAKMLCDIGKVRQIPAG